MIYGQDEPVLFPVADLYDSGMMGAYLSAVKDQYQRGLKDYDDFVSKYGDFSSPIQKDVEYWNNNTMGPLADAVNQMYANGIDPTRSPEARAVLSRMMRNIPYAKLANMRQSAENAKEYLKSRAKMAAEGLYNDDYERWVLSQQGLPDFEHWDSSVNGSWNRLSPGKYQDLNSSTSHWFDNINRKGYLYTKNGYDYFGVRDEDMQKVLTQNIPDFINTEYGKYQLELARRQLGGDASDIEALAKLKKNITAANQEVTINPSRELNKLEELKIEDSYARAREDRKYKRDREMADLQFERDKELARMKAGGNNGSGDAYQTWTNQYVTGIGIAAGIDKSKYADNGSYMYDISRNMKAHQKQIARSLGKDINSNQYVVRLGTDANADGMIANFAAEDANNTFNLRMRNSLGEPVNGWYEIGPELAKTIVTKYEMTGNTYGNGSKQYHPKKYKGRYENVTKIRPAADNLTLYTAYQKDGYIHQFRKVYVEYDNGFFSPAKQEEAWMDLGPISNYTNPNNNDAVDIRVDERAIEPKVIMNAAVNKGLGSQKTSNNATE